MRQNVVDVTETSGGGTRTVSKVQHPTVWVGADFQHSDTWKYTLTDEDIGELRGALDALERNGTDIIGINKKNFVIPKLAEKLVRLKDEVLNGRGFVLIKGVPISSLSQQQAAGLYWGIGSHFGYQVSQNAEGHMLGHVVDFGTQSSKKQLESASKHGKDVFLHTKFRGYNSNERLAFHVDFSDIIGLLCLQPAMAGGESLIVSSAAIHNKILATRPDLLEVLYEPFWIDRKGEIPAGCLPYFQMPVFNMIAGRLITYYSGGHMKTIGVYPELPDMTPQQREAMDLVDDLANDPKFHLSMDLEQGDIQLINNHAVLHSRASFQDFPDPELKRHLLRLWLVAPDGPVLPDWFYDRYGGGRRGGIYVPGVREFVSVEAGRSKWA